MYPQQQPYAPPQPPARRRKSAALPIVIIAAVLAALGVIVVAAVIAVGGDGKSTTPPVGPAPSQSEVRPGADLGAGTPGAACSTDRLGKTFTKDGVVYTCKGPKPYTWQK